jgi:endonuclease/exonuclease/phosphatase family metal-dependent hydrolase
MEIVVNITAQRVNTLWKRLGASGLLVGALVLQGCATPELRSWPNVQSYDVPARTVAVSVENSRTLRVMTLNLAHGRGESFHQLLQKTDTTIRNLNEISAMLKRERPDVVALQEADGPSFWSGNFHHVDYLARQGEFSSAVNGSQVDGLGLKYGTALMSNIDLRQAEAITFNPDLALTPKGFVVSTIDWPGNEQLQVDLVSLHLDFSSEATRRLQAQELIAFMRGRDRPMIVMGDFNTDWSDKYTTVRLIASELALKAYNPAAKGQNTFPLSNKRLDWILVSGRFEFRDYQVVSDAVSDHRGVIAELGLETRVVKNSYE